MNERVPLTDAQRAIEVHEHTLAVLRPYLRHIGNCGAVESDNPADMRCICGLRQTWLRL